MSTSKRFFALILTVAMLVALPCVAGAVELKADVVFVIDSTGSMGDEIRNVKDNITEFARYLESLNVNLRIGVIEYRDIAEDGEDTTVVHTQNYSPWHNTADEMVATLGNIGADGGGDTPETLVDAMGYLLDDGTMHFRSDAYRFAVILTDADVKNDNRHGLRDMEEVTDRLVEKGIYTSVISSTRYKTDYSDVYTRTDGIFADITSDFAKILKELADRIFGVMLDGTGPVGAEDIISVQSVTMNLTQTGVVTGKTTKLTAAVYPHDATDYTVNWHVDDTRIAEVEKVEGHTCEVKGVSTGVTRVVAVSNDGGFTASAKIYVVDKEEDLPIFFDDVAVEDWSYDAISFVNRNGYFSGSSATVFDPDGTMSRGTMVTVLYRIAGEPKVERSASFSDVKARYYYTTPIAWAAQNGVVKGYSEDLFGPEDAITREQVAQILYRYAQSLKLDADYRADLTVYPDGEAVSAWAADGMDWAVGTGLLRGKPDGRLDPGGSVTRAEMAVMTQRMVELAKAAK